MCAGRRAPTRRRSLDFGVVTHPAIHRVVCEPAHHGLQHVLLVAHVELLHGQHLTEPVRRQLPELLRERHVGKVRLQELCGGVVDVVEAVVQGEETDADAVLGGDAALQELAAQRLEVGDEEQVRRLHHVLDGVLTQRDLCVQDRQTIMYNDLMVTKNGLVLIEYFSSHDRSKVFTDTPIHTLVAVF